MFRRARVLFRTPWGSRRYIHPSSSPSSPLTLSNRRAATRFILTAGSVLGFFYLSKASYSGSIHADDSSESEKKKNSKETVYTQDEVADHNSLETGVWIIHGDGVYDVTEFIPQHPGGDYLMQAAGTTVDPFWNIYRQHLVPMVQNVLEQYRIGTLSPEDQKDLALDDSDDPYSNDPKNRDPALIVRESTPFNAEPPSEVVMASLITPPALWYVRNHLPVPEIDPKKYKLELEGEGMNSVTLTLDELKAFPKAQVTTTMQCAGNRRIDLNNIQQTQGVEWGRNAISTGTFTGVRLRDLLKHCGLKADYGDVDGPKHVWLMGADDPYDASIPFQKAMDPRGDVLIAYELNGEPLLPDHGFPVRAVVPGHAGARNVKWLNKIIMSQKESPSPWQSGNTYRGLGPNQVDFSKVDISKHPAVQELPVASAILMPPADKVISQSDEVVTVKGYAVSGGGRDIVRVDVSPDDGKTWMQANLTKLPQESGRAWAWTFWDADLPIPKASSMTIRSKAVDEAYNVQPDQASSIWNLRGILSNAQGKLQVKISED